MRLFVAVRPPEPACAALARALGREADPTWHVTLAFLGEQPGPEAFDLTAAAVRHVPFTLRLESGGTFHGRVLFAAVGGDTQALGALADDVRDTCRRAGAEVETRPFHGHVALARGRGLSVPPALLAHRGPTWPVSEVELVLSVLTKPSYHEVLASYPLTAQAPPSRS